MIVGPCGEETGAEAAALEALRQGTPVVFLRPSAETAAELGISEKQRRTANEAYIAPERDHPLWFAAVGDFLQFHGTADMYAEFGGRERVLAWIAGRDWALPYPAIVTGSYGAGRFAVFTYDLATSTVLFHQGRRDQASTGPHPDADGDGLFCPSDLFFGYRDRTLLDLPQADLQQQLLVRVLDWACAPQAPLARLWYYPDGAPAIVLFNGDSDGMTRPQMEWYTNMVEAHGGEYTVYLMEQHLPHLTPEMERDYRQRGHSAGPHIWHSQKPTVEQMRTRIQEEVALFEERYGYPPKTTRHHCVIWPGWVETAKALADAGFRMDTNFRAGDHLQYGYLDRQRPADAVHRRGRRIHRVLRAGDPLLRRLRAGGQELPAAAERGAGHRHLQGVYRCRLRPLPYGGAPVLPPDLRNRSEGEHRAIHPHGGMVRGGLEIRGTAGIARAKHRCVVHVQRAAAGNRAYRAALGRAGGVLHVTVEAQDTLPGGTLALPAHYDGRQVAQVLLDGEPMRRERRSVAGAASVLAVGDFSAGTHEVAVHYQ